MEVNRNSLYGIEYYKRNTFMGSLGIMNYRIYKTEQETEDDAQDTKPQVYLEAVCWRGPYIFSKTEEKKIYNRFAFEDKGLDEIVKWLNQEYIKMSEDR